MKYVILTILSFIIGVTGGYVFPKETSCEYHVFHEGEKLCLSEKQKEYIENVEAGEFNRLKSKRGVFPK